MSEIVVVSATVCFTSAVPSKYTVELDKYGQVTITDHDFEIENRDFVVKLEIEDEQE